MTPKTRLIGADTVVMDDDRLVIVSPVNMENWDVRRHRHALIRFGGRTWRIERRTACIDRTIQYELVPWTSVDQELPGPEIDYGPAFVASRDRAIAAARRRDRATILLDVVAPLTGFLPARMKGRLEIVYGIDPVASTRHSVYLEYLGALAGLSGTAIGLTTGAFPIYPFLLLAVIVVSDGLVRWDRLFWEERPPPGFYEWLVTRRESPPR